MKWQIVSIVKIVDLVRKVVSVRKKERGKGNERAGATLKRVSEVYY
jgi:hypothetical protein